MKVKCTIRLLVRRCEWHSWYIEREHSFNDCKQTAFSHMLVCPSCQTIWAKFIIEKDRIVWPKAQFCEQCPIISDPWHLVPGSLLVEEGWGVVDESLMEALPPELMLRELELLAKVQGTDSHEQPSIPDPVKPFDLEQCAADAYERAFAPGGSERSP